MNFETQTPSKNSFKFKEVTSITGVKPYVLRFWESEFEQISPSQSEAGHKIYSSSDVEFVKKVKDLLFESKLSIPEAKLKLLEDLNIENELKLKAAEISMAPAANCEEETVLGAQLSEQKSDVFSSNSSSFELMQKALKGELLQQKQFNDTDVVHLVQAKKKLSVVLAKCNNIIEKNGWS